MKTSAQTYSDDDSSCDDGDGGNSTWGAARPTVHPAFASSGSMPASMLQAPKPVVPPAVWGPAQPPPRASTSRSPLKTNVEAKGGGGYYSDMDDDSEDEHQLAKPTTAALRLPLPASFPRPQSSHPAIAAEEKSQVKKKPSFSDFYDYSDMEGDEEDDDPLAVVPKFAVPEQRGALLDQKVRQERDVPVGGRNQDYLGLAYIYKIQRPYSDHNYKAVCVLCHQRPAQDVFFPCEHRCVCRSCIKSERFVEDRLMAKTEGGYNMCPLCACTIKLVLPHEHGKEVAKYWDWVEEIAPELPPGFLRKFRHSAGVLEAVYITGTFQSETDTNCLPS